MRLAQLKNICGAGNDLRETGGLRRNNPSCIRARCQDLLSGVRRIVFKSKQPKRRTGRGIRRPGCGKSTVGIGQVSGSDGYKVTVSDGLPISEIVQIAGDVTVKAGVVRYVEPRLERPSDDESADHRRIAQKYSARVTDIGGQTKLRTTVDEPEKQSEVKNLSWHVSTLVTTGLQSR